MAIEFSKTVALLAAIASATKGLLNAREEAKINDVAIHLQGIALDLQSEMMMIQADYQNVLRTCEDLKNKLAEQERWDKERPRYHLQKVGGSWSALVYALKVKNPSVEPAHWLCAHCYEDKKKSIIQLVSMNTYFCSRCRTELTITGFPE